MAIDPFLDNPRFQTYGSVSNSRAVSEKRLALTSSGNIRYQFKAPYRGTTHVLFEPLNFIAKLAALEVFVKLSLHILRKRPTMSFH